jgi:hypothetical protein
MDLRFGEPGAAEVPVPTRKQLARSGGCSPRGEFDLRTQPIEVLDSDVTVHDAPRYFVVGSYDSAEIDALAGVAGDRGELTLLTSPDNGAYVAFAALTPTKIVARDSANRRVASCAVDWELGDAFCRFSVPPLCTRNGSRPCFVVRP